MIRTRQPVLEVLEGKALLSGVAASASGLVSSLTAVANRTLSGAQVIETFTETNVSNHDITVAYGATNAGFTVSQGGKTIWNPYVGILPQNLVLDVLSPGQSLTIHDIWDDRSNLVSPDQLGLEGPPLSGTFTISNSLDQGQATATVTVPPSWTVPVRMTHIVPPKPPAQIR